MNNNNYNYDDDWEHSDFMKVFFILCFFAFAAIPIIMFFALMCK